MSETYMETETDNKEDFKNIYQEAETDICPDVTVKTEVEVGYERPALFRSLKLLELCNACWTNPTDHVQSYLRGCKWSPDGTCCLTVVNNKGMHITELPRDLYEGSVDTSRDIDILVSIIEVKEAGLVYDFCWYPGMNSTYPETCCWLTTLQNAPIQMWDAFDGSLRCSYRGFNAVDEMEPAISVCFTPDGTRVIGGYKKMLRTFDVDRPGRDCAEHKISSPASCLATDSNLLAVGSWNTSVGLYSVNELGTYKSIGKMHGHSGGVTHMKFTPDGLKLVTGARKDHRLLVWDIRYHRRPVNVLERAVDTNQRVYFDISPCGKYLVSGGTDGIVRVWDATAGDWSCSVEGNGVDAALKFPLHNDCCNSVSIHPSRPILATGSGQYHFSDPVSMLEDESIVEDEEQGTHNYSSPKRGDERGTDKYSTISENCQLFWWIGDIDVKDVDTEHTQES